MVEVEKCPRRSFIGPNSIFFSRPACLIPTWSWSRSPPQVPSFPSPPKEIPRFSMTPGQPRCHPRINPPALTSCTRCTSLPSRADDGRRALIEWTLKGALSHGLRTWLISWTLRSRVFIALRLRSRSKVLRKEPSPRCVESQNKRPNLTTSQQKGHFGLYSTLFPSSRFQGIQTPNDFSDCHAGS